MRICYSRVNQVSFTTKETRLLLAYIEILQYFYLQILALQHPSHPQSPLHCRWSHPPDTQLLQSATIREETAESPSQDQQTERQLHPPGCQEAELPPVLAPPPLSYPTNHWTLNPPPEPFFLHVLICIFVIVAFLCTYMYIYLICTYLYFYVLLLVFSVICMHQGVRE